MKNLVTAIAVAVGLCAYAVPKPALRRKPARYSTRD